jgi:hypothetical protein
MIAVVLSKEYSSAAQKKVLRVLCEVGNNEKSPPER